MKIVAFPKFYRDNILSKMTVFAWIEMSRLDKLHVVDQNGALSSSLSSPDHGKGYGLQ